ncbi:MAG: TRAP transporter TatT component family protein [Sandaracinaceae bacterium]|jgi:tetratricopeptide (TPR) repeat protein|nr:TRAP transporter TatT component family protein [Sandaracinaceae bacterium]
MKTTIQILGLALALASVGCGGGRTSAFDEGTTTSGGEVTAEAQAHHDELVAQGDAAFANRGDEAQLRAAVDAYTQAVAAVPGDHATWAKLTRAQYFLAYGHMEFNPELEAETTAMYQAAITSAEHGLAALSPQFAEQVRSTGQFSSGLASLDQRAVPLVYWRSSALGRWARRDGFATVLAYKDEIRASMTRCLELDREYFFGGPDRYFGAFFAVAPSYAGGDLERSRQHFDYSISRYPGYFGTHVLYAVEYAVKTQDRELFTRELQWVIDNDPNMLPEVAAENVVEQRKAREALARADELFE